MMRYLIQYQKLEEAGVWIVGMMLADSLADLEFRLGVLARFDWSVTQVSAI